MSMYYIGRVLNNVKEFYNEINGATLTGAIDVVIVEQPDGTYTCSPFHVRFGKIGVLRSREKVVDIEINGEPQGIHMKLGDCGEAFFVEELDSGHEDIPDYLATSPIPSSHLDIPQGRRRNSIDLGDQKVSLNIDKLENEVNDYTKRRYTADNNDEKNRGREFIKRHINLGNIEIVESNMDDLTLSLHSNAKESVEDICNNDITETIFTMDSLDMENKSEIIPTEPNKLAVTLAKAEESPSDSSKSGKKKRRKKSIMKKKATQRKISNVSENPNAEQLDQEKESGTDNKASDSNDRSSMESSPSEESKEIGKSDTENTPSGSSTNINRKVPMDPDFHFFSDTELTTGPGDSRANTPVHIETVQSDTEFEVQKSKDESRTNQSQSWAWGEFPTSVSKTSSPSTETPESISTELQEKHNSMLSSMFSFMKHTKHRRRNSVTDGVYLQDISSGAIEPEVAALYFAPNMVKSPVDADMDCESGNGPSLTQSPNSAEGSKSIDSDFEEQSKIAQAHLREFALSMCGWDPEPTEENFLNHVVAFSDLCNNPMLFESPNLVVRIREKYYNWKVAAPIITSIMIYHRPLPQSTVDQLTTVHMPSNINDNNIIEIPQGKESKQEPKGYYYSSWWSWRRRSRESTPATQEIMDKANKTSSEKMLITVQETKSKVDVTVCTEEGYHGSQSSGSETEKTKDVNIIEKQETIVCELIEGETIAQIVEKCKKSLRLTTSQIKKMNLRNGMNEVEFSVTTAYQGTTRCKCHLYKWKWDDKIVISDIDGTITKSDVLGHILPIVGNDWAQNGVAQLFNKIKDNGYKLMYLSARAIGQARTTREYLKSIKQGDLTMPDGPVLLNPTSLITAFHREVIEKKPEQFKISCMSDIRNLFPTESNPFYAGYGNRINDVWAYRAVGIPIVRIFTINPKGELKHELTQTFQSSYSGQVLVVNDVFPPLINKIITLDIDDDDIDDSYSSSSD